MQKLLICLCIFFSTLMAKGQSCEELIEYVKSNNYGTTYNSPTSDAISEVTFYTKSEDIKRIILQ